MAYSIRLPDGTLVRNIPDELSPEQAKERIIKAYPQYAPESGVLRQAADIPVQVGRGAVMGVRMLSDALGADNPVSQALRGAEDYLGDLLSAQAKQDQKEIARILKDAEDKGVLDQVKAGIQALTVAPVDLVSQVLGTAVPTIAAGMAGAAAKLGAVGIGTLQAGTGAAMGAGLTKGNIFEVVKEELTAAGVPENVAEERAKAAQNYTGENWDQIILGGTLGGAAALGPLERIFARLPAISPQVAAKNLFTRAGVAGVAEAAPEAAQAFQEQVAQNLALQREGFDVPTFRGAVANATLEGLAGFGIGAPIGALEGKPGATKPPGQQEPTEPAAPPPPTPIVPEGELTPEEEAELQARIAAAPPPPPAAGIPVEPTPTPPAPIAPQQVTATPEAVALPEPQQVTPQIPVEAAPELEALTAQLGQIQQARMDPTLTPDDPAFLELDQQEAAIQTRIQQLTATPEAVTQPPAQPLAPPVAPVVEPEVIPEEAVVTPEIQVPFDETLTPPGPTLEDQVRAQKAEERRERQAAQEAKRGEFVLQNRDRSSTGSIQQMQNIANAPDYSRAGFSRTPDGAPIIAFGDYAPEQLGREDVVTTARGRKIPVQYAVVEADEVITSNDIQGRADNRYGDKTVPGPRAIAGNGRVTGLRESFERGTATPYVEEMAADSALHGISPDVIAGMQKPVLVRVMPQEGLTRDIGDELNISSMLELSPVEQAKNDLNRVEFDALQFDEDGEITNESLSQFIAAQPVEERTKLIDRGLPTKQARQRLENAIFARAYADDDLIAMFAQTEDVEARLVINALAQVAPQMAQLEGAGDLDIRDIVTDAAKIIVSGKRRGLKLKEISSQVDMTVDPDTKIIVDMFAQNPRSNKAAIESLRNAAELAYNESIRPEEGLFGVEPRRERRDIMEQMRRGYEPTRTEDVAAAERPRPAPSDVEREAEPITAGVPPADQDFALTGQTPEELAELQRRELSGEAEAERDRLEAEEAARAAAEAERKIADQKRDTFQLAPPPSAPAVQAAGPVGDLFGTTGIREQPTRAPRRVAAEPSPIEQMAEDARAEKAEKSPFKIGERVVYNKPESKIFPDDPAAKIGATVDFIYNNNRVAIVRDDTGETDVVPTEDLSKPTEEAKIPPIEEAIEAELKKAGYDDLDKMSKQIKDEFGVSKPVADAYARAVQNARIQHIRAQYGEITAEQLMEALNARDSLRRRIDGIVKRLKSRAAAQAEAEPKKEEKPSIRKTREVAEGTVVERIELPDNIEIRIVKLKDGYSVYQYDLDADQIVMGQQRQFRTPAFKNDQDAYRAAEAFASDMFDQVVPKMEGEMKGAMKERLSRGEDVINNKTPDPDVPADQRLVLMSCCATKNKAIGMGPAMDVYTGVFFQTFKNKVKDGAMPNLRILSAKYGFINPDQRIEIYDQVMDKTAADKFMLDDKLVEGFPSNIKDVLIVGSDQYQRVMKAAIEDLIKAGKIDKGASINVTKGGIGEQRSQLGKYLSGLPSTERARPVEVQTWDVFYTGTSNLAAENVEAPSAQKAKEIAAEKEGLKSIARLTAKKKEKKLTGAYRLAIRQQNAADRFIDSVVEQFGLTKDQAQTALNRLLKEKVVSLDPVAGQFKLKDGRFWDKEVMRRAAGVEAEAEPEPKKEEKQVKTEVITPSEDKYLGVNSSGEKLYERKNGERYRMRMDRVDRPSGYPDFGGDLALVEKEEKPRAEQFVRGTEEQLKEIKEFAKRYGGSEVAYYDPDKDIGMVLAFGKFDGDPKYIPYIKGVFGRTAFDISVAKFPDVLPYKAELLEIKERLEKAAEKKHQENPFIKFERGIALSDGMDPKIEGIIREWKDMLGLGGINIYFSTTEDAKKNINNFTGPHRRIGSATIDTNERGSMRRMEGGASYYVVFDKSTSTTKMLEVIAHEIGHVHEKVAFDQAPQEVKDKLKAAYEKWLEQRKDKTSREAMQMLRAKTTAKTTDIGQTIETAEQLDKLDPYWSKFSEWYADQVSRWAVTDEKPVGVVEKFFARLGAALRRFYQNLKGQGYLPDETFVQYLKQVKPTIVETIPGPIKDPVNQDMSSKMQTDLFGSPGEAKDIGEAMEVKGKKKLPPGRSPELTAAAQAMQAGTMTAEEFNKLVDVYKPIPLYAEPLKPATSEQVFDALDVKKREQINPQIPNGTKVGLRLDIPAFNRKGVFVVSIHQKRTASAPGKVIGYGSVAKAKNVTFGVGNQLKALEIAAGSAKDALQTIEGEYVNVTPEQAFAEAQRAIKDPSYVQVGIDPTRHAYFYDRRTTLPVVSAEEVLQIGNMILAKKPVFGSKQNFLYNIDGGPIAGDTQAADMSFLDRLFAEDKTKRKEERNETMAYYKSIRRKEAALLKKVREYGSTIELQRQLNNLNEIGRELKEDLDLDKQPVYSAENFLRQARAALEGAAPYQGQAISPEVFAVIQAVYMDDPKLLEGLRLSIKPEFSKQDQELRRAFGMKRQTAGTFMPMQRLINLYTGTRGVTSPATIRHELTHTLEQMMTEKQRQALLNSYLDAIKKAMRKHKDAKSQEFFDLVLEFLNNPTDRAVAKMNDAMPSMDFYQYTSPSEYWAVNAEKLMAQRLGGAWDRFKKAIRKVFEKMKKIFGFDNRFAVHDVFDKIMSGSKERMDRRALVDYIGTSGESFAFLASVQEDADLVRRYNHSHTSQTDSAPLRRILIGAAENSKDLFKSMAESPNEAINFMFNSVIRGITYLRNKNVWFGTGLNEADRIRYSGDVKTAEGLATASVALDNMIRGGNIGTQVIMQGGIEFNPETQMYVAVQKDKSMANVYRAEAKLKEKLGDQLGTDIEQGYLQAKRSRSIIDEVATREKAIPPLEAKEKETNAEIDRAASISKALDANPNTTATQRQASDVALRKAFREHKKALRELQDAQEELKTIKRIREDKVTMSDQEIEDFIQREEAHPELKEILDNFNAVNQNLLRFWRDVGLLSEPRYERLSSIKDYVPWYRVMDDDADIHDPVQATTRSATNIGKEKLFKHGKPSVVTDFTVEENQKVFRVQPGKVNAVKLGGVRLKPEQYSVTPNGELTLKVEAKPGQLLVVETQREIENMIDNMTRNVMRMTMNGLRQYAAKRIVEEYATREAGKIKRFASVDRNKGRFDYIENGRRTIVEIQDPLIAEAVLGMETVGMKMWEPLAAAANFTRRTITLSPVFQLKQVFKDAPTAALVTGVKNPAALMGGVMRDFVGAVRDSDPVAGILRSQGIGGFYSPARTPEADVKRQIGIINNNTYDYVMKALDHFGDSSDMAQRIAIYKRVMAETGNEALALYQAANVINFLRHGSGQVAQALVKTVPFLNAYAQSIDVLFNALVGGGLRGKDRAAALKQLAVTGGLLAGTTLLYAMLVGDDDDYMKMDDQSKIRSYMIPGTDVVLPMNTSAAFFFKAIPELIYNKVVNEGTENEVDAKRLRTAMKEAAVDLLLGPTPVPSAVKPVIEISLDYNFFTSRPITPRGMDNLDAYQQYDMRTSDAARLLSGLTGTKENRVLNPMEADHLIRSIFGTAGAMVAWSSNLIGASSEYRPEMGLKDMPVTGAFLRPEVPRGREDLFYKLKENTDRKYRTFNRLIERDQTAEAEAYLSRHPNLIAYYDYTSEMDTQLKEINAAIRFIGETQDPSYTPETKRREIQELLNLKQDILEGIEQFRKEAYAD